MRIFIFRSFWNPFFAGSLAGALAVASAVATMKYLEEPKYFGASSSFVRAAGLIEQQVDSGHVAENRYFQSTGIKVDWQMAFVGGIFAGAFISALLGGTFKFETVPPIWEECYGGSSLKRAVWAFLGGVTALFGARLAGGCPSGHGLSGLMQMSIGGIVAMLAFVIGGSVTAGLLYGRSR
ncbi:MAG: YeeE/YedE thiosulfate transporter family protein [Kiritimatiellia bacterium]